MSKKRRGKRRKLTFQYSRTPVGVFPSFGPEVLLLDSFTDANLIEWQAHADALQEYHYQWYFELESQRATHQQAIRESLIAGGGGSVNLETWGRQLDVQYVTHPLCSYGSLQWVGGRFNYGMDIDSSRFAPFPALYLAEDSETAFREYFQIERHGRAPGGLTGGELALARERSFAWVRVEGVVHNVFDATKPTCLAAFTKVIGTFALSSRVRELEKRLALLRPLTLITTSRELLASLMDPNWRHYPAQFNVPANSQVFGRLLVDAGFEAVLYRSTKSGKRCLALFTRQLNHSATRIKVIPPGPPGLMLAELSSDNGALAEMPARS